MAFFGIFKSKQERALEDSLKDIQKIIFPGGEKDIERDCQRIDALTKGKIQHSTIRGFVAGCKTIVNISDSEDDETYVNSIMTRANGLITRDEALDVYAYLEGEAGYYDKMNRMFNDMENDSDDENELFGDLPWIYSKGVRSDEIPNGYGEYGLCKTNPVPTISIQCAGRYLSRLRFRGNPVDANRLGSTSSDVTPGSIDVYKLSVSDQDVATIFICPYHKRNSRKAPNGFTLV